MLKRSLEATSEILGTDAQDLDGRRNDLFALRPSASTKEHQVYRCEPGDGLALPFVIVPHEGSTEDLFATVATYYPHVSPLTAITYVLGADISNLLNTSTKGTSKRALERSRITRRICLGASVGEATLAGLSTADLGVPSYAACRRTLAYAIGRGSFIHGDNFDPRVMADRWIRLRSMTGLKVSLEAVESVLFSHLAFSGESIGSETTIELAALRDAISCVANGKDSDGLRLARTFADAYPAAARHLKEMDGPFDGRLGAFTRIVESIQADSRGQQHDEIAVAYFCNKILPGSFSHSGVLIKLVEYYPAALVWYGVFSMLSKGLSTKRWGDGLFAKLERDMMESFSFECRPRCDISLDEFEVLSRGSLRADTVRPSHQRSLLVALIPGVDIYSRFGSDTSPNAEKIFSDEARLIESASKASKLIEEALRLLKLSSGSEKEARAAVPAVRKKKYNQSPR